MSFYHGVEIVELDSGSRPITTVRSSVIGIVGHAKNADASIFPLNKPVLIAGKDLVKIAALGSEGTLVDAMTGIYASGIAPFVVVVRIEQNDDPATEISNVIGGIDPITAERKGMQALLDAYSIVKVKPKIIIAPTFTNEASVVNAIVPIVNSLKAISVIEGPGTTDEAAVAYAANFDSQRLYLVDPRIIATKDGVETVYANSSYVAGHIARIDNEYGWNYSPSNHVIYGVEGTERAIDYDGSATCRANYLNENKVAAIIHEEGYRLWGNYTLSSDVKWQFLSVRRIADMINESIQIAHRWAVDRGITKTLLDDIVREVNSYIRTLITQEKILGGNCWANSELNPASEIVKGNLIIDFDFSATYPAQHIKIRSILSNQYIEEIFR